MAYRPPRPKTVYGLGDPNLLDNPKQSFHPKVFSKAQKRSAKKI